MNASKYAHVVFKIPVSSGLPISCSLVSQGAVLGNWLPKRGLGPPIRSNNTNRSCGKRETGRGERCRQSCSWETLLTHSEDDFLTQSHSHNNHTLWRCFEVWGWYHMFRGAALWENTIRTKYTKHTHPLTKHTWQLQENTDSFICIHAHNFSLSW